MVILGMNEGAPESLTEPLEETVMFLKEPTHILLLLLVVVLLFGAKRLPDTARSIGKSLKIFKSELKDGASDEQKPDSEKN